ncbi:unnamed protein product [Urochloa decumbens]|uniref:Aminotransferase-like plant mobile domain-containing protein n=1 Tax=Urochloa decumbens TaxID=240449 RepID=A0ABC9E320_9POAL
MATRPPTRKRNKRSTGLSSLGVSPDAALLRQKQCSAPKIQSMCNPNKVSEIFRKFRGQKASLVRSIGFEGLLRIPQQHNLDDTLTVWLLKRFDPNKMAICLDNGACLPIRDIDVHLVLGIPFEGDPIVGCEQLCNDVVCALRQALFTDNTIEGCIEGPRSVPCPSFTLEYLEHILVKDYGDSMTEQEKSAFKIAIVLFSMAYFLAPSQPFYAFPVSILNNFVSAGEPKMYNWARFVLITLAEAAKHIQSQLSEHKEALMIYGCSLLIQIFYLDNLDFGPSSTIHMDLPRLNTFTGEKIQMLTLYDSTDQYDNQLLQYGKSKVRDEMDVCYTRGWRKHKTLTKYTEDDYDNDYLNCWELFRNGLELFDKCAGHIRGVKADNITSIPQLLNDTLQPLDHIRTQFLDTLNKLSLRVVKDIQRNNLVLYDRHIPPPETSSSRKRKNTEISSASTSARKKRTSPSHDAEESGIQVVQQQSVLEHEIEDTSLAVVQHEIGASTVTQDIAERCPMKKIVTRHSRYPASPFSMAFGHESVPRVKKIKVYRWLSYPYMPHKILTRPWFLHNEPYTISMSGYDVRSCMELSGSFSIHICDAIMRLWTHLDHKMYRYNVRFGEIHKTWRHFLPASFAQSVFGQEDYLQSEKIRASFIGGHIRYRVENCRMFVLPVKYHDKWSCYLWDLKEKTLTVMDPCLMRSNPIRVELHHEQAVQDLHKALIDCIKHFFVGWSVDDSGWRFIYATNLGPRCLPVNSGLFAVHYARASDGQALYYDVKEPTDSNLSEARAEILYWLFVMSDNHGYLPEDLLEDLGIYI